MWILKKSWCQSFILKGRCLCVWDAQRTIWHSACLLFLLQLIKQRSCALWMPSIRYSKGDTRLTAELHNSRDLSQEETIIKSSSLQPYSINQIILNESLNEISAVPDLRNPSVANSWQLSCKQAQSHQMTFYDAKNKFKKDENLISCRLTTKPGEQWKRQWSTFTVVKWVSHDK